MSINKVIYGGNVLIDLTADTAEASTVLAGQTFHDKSGAAVTGTCAYDSDTSNDTATVSSILLGQTAHARGAELTGTMPNNGAVAGTITTKAGAYTVPAGYHDGSGRVQISSTEQAKIIASNIREGVTILGVVGTCSEGSENSQPNKNVTPTTAQQVITPDSGYTCMRQVTVAAIPYVTEMNSAGGYTVTIAG